MSSESWGGICEFLCIPAPVCQSGRGAKYTRSRLPVELVYQEACADKSAALRREYEIKQLTRVQKLKLIEQS